MKKQNAAEKTTKKSHSGLLFSTIVSSFICILCLCSATFALFSGGVSNTSNTLESGVYGIDVEIINSENEILGNTLLGNGSLSYTFEAESKYTVKITTTAKTTVTTGFCIISIGNQKYKTVLIGEEGVEELEFELDVKSQDLTVIFSSSWGIPSSTEVTPGCVLEALEK